MLSPSSQNAIRTETKRIIGLRFSGNDGFWAHLGRRPDRLLAVASNDNDSEDLKHSRCLWFRHGIKTYDDALKLLDSWHNVLHQDNRNCECDTCSDAYLAACRDPLTCRRILVQLVDTKSPNEWDGQFFPPIPDNLDAPARSIYLFTLGWAGMITTPFDNSMREHFIVYFKRRHPEYSTTPSFIIGRIFRTYAQNLHRIWKVIQRRELERHSLSPAPKSRGAQEDEEESEGEGEDEDEDEDYMSQDAYDHFNATDERMDEHDGASERAGEDEDNPLATLNRHGTTSSASKGDHSATAPQGSSTGSTSDSRRIAVSQSFSHVLSPV